MSQQTIRDSYLSLRSILHGVGLQECMKRGYFVDVPGSIGVHHWTFLAYSKIAELSRLGRWEGKVPNEPTLRRRANYLASKDWVDEGIPRPLDEPPLWVHLSLQVKDVNPWKSREVVELQSAYRPASREDAR